MVSFLGLVAILNVNLSKKLLKFLRTKMSMILILKGNFEFMRMLNAAPFMSHSKTYNTILACYGLFVESSLCRRSIVELIGLSLSFSNQKTRGGDRSFL